jgi:hypothetical protein
MNPVMRHARAAERLIPRSEGFERRTRIAGAILADLRAKADAERRRLDRDLTEGEVERLLAEAGTPEQLAQRYLGGPVRQDLVERYLAAVERHLPKPGASDIVAELREAITGEIERREAETGQAISDDDIAGLLKTYGPPALAAGRYSGRKALIGEDLAPLFWPAMRIVLGIVIAASLAIGLLAMVRGVDPWQAGAQAFNRVLELGLMAFAQVTLVFFILERTGSGPRLRAAWNPKSLPADHVRPPKSLFDSLFNLFFDVLFLLAWVGVVDLPNALAGDREHSVTLHLSLVWDALWWPILVLGVLSAVVHVADIFHPAWSAARAALSILGRAGASLVAGALLLDGPWIEARVDGVDGTRIDAIASILNSIVQVSLVIGILIWLAGAAIEIVRLARWVR